eukprot:s181_g48.t2
MAIAACVRQIVAKPMQASQGRIGVRHETLRGYSAPVAAAERLTRTVSGLKSDAVPASNAERMGLAVKLWPLQLEFAADVLAGSLISLISLQLSELLALVDSS